VPPQLVPLQLVPPARQRPPLAEVPPLQDPPPDFVIVIGVVALKNEYGPTLIGSVLLFEPHAVSITAIAINAKLYIIFFFIIKFLFS
jgi:hypothetical protein